MSTTQIIKEFNLANSNVLYRWVKQYQLYGKIFETSGKVTKLNNQNKGRPRKYSKNPYQQNNLV